MSAIINPASVAVSKDDQKNSLPVGTVLQLQGYGWHKYVIVENWGINEQFPHYGARYKAINVKDHTFKILDAFTLQYIADKDSGRTQAYIMDYSVEKDAVANILEKANKKELIEEVD